MPKPARRKLPAVTEFERRTRIEVAARQLLADIGALVVSEDRWNSDPFNDMPPEDKPLYFGEFSEYVAAEHIGLEDDRGVIICWPNLRVSADKLAKALRGKA